jgi:quercetin dioxygenase-like cupin family protein
VEFFQYFTEGNGMTRSISLVFVVAFMQGIVAASARAQPTPGAPTSAGIVRAVLANAALPSVVDAPRYYKLVRVSLAAKQTTTYNGAIGFVFVLSGSLEVMSGADRQQLSKEDGLLVAAGKSTTFKAGGSEPAVFLHFVLPTAGELDKPMEDRPAVVTELYATKAPIPGLKPGPYEFTLVRVSFPPRLPANPFHHRSGAAVYFVHSGTGMFTTGGKSELRPTGAIQYEPYDLVHQWGNPGEARLVIIQANISQEGVPAVIMLKDEAAGATK